MSRLDDHWDTAPLYYDVIGVDGRLLLCNQTQAAALGYEKDELAGAPLDTIYTRASLKLLRDRLAKGPSSKVEERLRLQLRRRDRSLVEVVTALDWTRIEGLPAMRLVKTRVDSLVESLNQLRRETEILRSFVDTARDACWCIEFEETVDLKAPDSEIIRQVFENACYWRLCNRAMSRLYKLPEGLDFNQQNVRYVFARNPENEAFVQQLIEANFHIDGAPSYDQRYDGRWIHAENDVRCHIENGRLLRMWGTVRNMSDQKLKERELTQRFDAMLNVLSSTPDPILVLSTDGLLEAANPALEWRFGWPVDDVLGRPVSKILRYDGAFRRAVANARPGGSGIVVPVSMFRADGLPVQSEASVAAIAEEEPSGRVVVTIRPVRTGTGAAMGPVPESLEKAS